MGVMKDSFLHSRNQRAIPPLRRHGDTHGVELKLRTRLDSELWQKNKHFPLNLFPRIP